MIVDVILRLNMVKITLQKVLIKFADTKYYLDNLINSLNSISM